MRPRLFWLSLGGGLFSLRSRALEEQHVGLRLVNHVVHPPLRLLHAQLPPLHLTHEATGGDEAGKVLWENHVTVLEHVIVVLVTVQNLALQFLNNDECFALPVRVQGEEILRRFRWHNELQVKERKQERQEKRV
ncbi:cyclin-dependent kinase regulatory subunit [Leishmania tarentolae]|uniref:Cyclin-dependent kinase regulatory subunit n=1 Tax=Leishmania tarentolae TaxID=5689 RepID=A0A640KPS9_LEITA|nr:cyclin-dependent kinase regulatory subunit [Leishmania tarentolae]